MKCVLSEKKEEALLAHDTFNQPGREVCLSVLIKSLTRISEQLVGEPGSEQLVGEPG